VDPANARLNYLYTILLAESSVALSAFGPDPSLGYIHADTPYRDSLACDLMEAIRPDVDEFLFGLQTAVDRGLGTKSQKARRGPHFPRVTMRLTSFPGDH
jgi:CRISPR/Cas system-associated endonuclease Cas1